jgi:hypothetical protein
VLCAVCCSSVTFSNGAQRTSSRSSGCGNVLEFDLEFGSPEFRSSESTLKEDSLV